MTVTGKTLKENVEQYHYKFPENTEVIKTLEEPFGFSGAVAIMRGNLCPKTGVANQELLIRVYSILLEKQSALTVRMMRTRQSLMVRFRMVT